MDFDWAREEHNNGTDVFIESSPDWIWLSKTEELVFSRDTVDSQGFTSNHIESDLWCSKREPNKSLSKCFVQASCLNSHSDVLKELSVENSISRIKMLIRMNKFDKKIEKEIFKTIDFVIGKRYSN